MSRRIALLSTGGTIEKTYNESDGTISNQRSVLEIMLAGLILRGVQIERIPVMNKDSQFMDDDDHDRVCPAVRGNEPRAVARRTPVRAGHGQG